jgi:serine/threonine protein kinase
MPTLSELANVLIGCRIVTRERWEQAVDAGGEDLAAVLDALASDPPDWWDRKAADDPPPGLTDYQRDLIEFWYTGGEVSLQRELALNQFLLLEKLGQGGQGAVYRGRQLNPPRFVAVKTLVRDTESGRQRFEQEARAMMKIQHPAVARFYLYERVRDAANRPTDEYLIAMELVDGTDLNRLVQWTGPVPWPFVARWAVELLGGLAVIHKSGFIHRDVKPANVMILGPAPEPGVAPKETAAKLLDFGAVKTADLAGDEESPEGGKSRVFVGTREYAPPEQWGGRVVPASDLYALGAALFFALAGRPPYQVEGRSPKAFMKAHASAPIPDVREHNPDAPAELSRLIRQMMAKHPGHRGTADELIKEFRQLLVLEGAEPERPVAPSQPRKPRPTRPAPAPTPRPTPRRQAEPRGALDPVLGFFERVFLPARLRPAAGHEPPARERLAALLRRPLVLLTLAVLLGLAIFLVVR